MENYDLDNLNELCSKINLLEYASKTMDFEKRGSDSYATHCCLHIDKTPSLFISPSKNLFHCFSCGKSGTIINWIMTFEHLSFPEAVQKVCVLTGADISHLKQCSALKIYKDIYRSSHSFDSNKKFDRPILDLSEINKFQDIVPSEWCDEGISPNIMKKYCIRVDEKANRIVYPVYDKDYHLIGFKGRTRYPDHKALKIPKYQNYQSIGTTDFFVGMKENISAIEKRNEIIIFEGIKSGLKLSSFGWGDNWVAAECSYLNEEQVKILIKLAVKDIVIAFDNDVQMQKIYGCTNNLRKFANVYVIRDRKFKKNRLLPENKMSPVDAGKEVWETLYNERIKL